MKLILKFITAAALIGLGAIGLNTLTNTPENVDEDTPSQLPEINNTATVEENPKAPEQSSNTPSSATTIPLNNDNSTKIAIQKCFTDALSTTTQSFGNAESTDDLLPNSSNTVPGSKISILNSNLQMQDITTHIKSESDSEVFHITITGERTEVKYVSSIDKEGKERKLHIAPSLEFTATVFNHQPTVALSKTTNPYTNLDTSPRTTNNNNYYNQLNEIKTTLYSIDSSISSCLVSPR